MCIESIFRETKCRENVSLSPDEIMTTIKMYFYLEKMSFVGFGGFQLKHICRGLMEGSDKTEAVLNALTPKGTVHK